MLQAHAHDISPADISPEDYHHKNSPLDSSSSHGTVSPASAPVAGRHTASSTPSRASLAARFHAVQPDRALNSHIPLEPPAHRIQTPSGSPSSGVRLPKSRNTGTPPESPAPVLRRPSAEGSAEQAELSPAHHAQAASLSPSQKAADTATAQAATAGADASEALGNSGKGGVNSEKNGVNSVKGRVSNGKSSSAGSDRPGGFSYKEKLMTAAGPAAAKSPTASLKASPVSSGRSVQLSPTQRSAGRSSSNSRNHRDRASSHDSRVHGSTGTSARADASGPPRRDAELAEAQSSQAGRSPQRSPLNCSHKVMSQYLVHVWFGVSLGIAKGGCCD